MRLDMVSTFYVSSLIVQIGYELVVKDMSLKRKYTHEWRESWEKIDTIRDVMRQFPHGEWFWWLNLVALPSRTMLISPAYVHHGTFAVSRHSDFLTTR